MKKTNGEYLESMLYIMRTHGIINDTVDVDYIKGTVICLTDGSTYDAASKDDEERILNSNNGLSYFFKIWAEAKMKAETT